MPAALQRSTNPLFQTTINVPVGGEPRTAAGLFGSLTGPSSTGFRALTDSLDYLLGLVAGLPSVPGNSGTPPALNSNGLGSGARRIEQVNCPDGLSDVAGLTGYSLGDVIIPRAKFSANPSTVYGLYVLCPAGTGTADGNYVINQTVSPNGQWVNLLAAWRGQLNGLAPLNANGTVIGSPSIGNSDGVDGTGHGSGNGVGGAGAGASLPTGQSAGVAGVGASAGGPGVVGTGGTSGGVGVQGTGTGSVAGVLGVGSGGDASNPTTHAGVVGRAGTGGNYNGVEGTGTGSGAGVSGSSAGAGGGAGVIGHGLGSDIGVEGSAASGPGVSGSSVSGPGGQFLGNSLRGALNLVGVSSRPSPASAGDIIFRSDTGRLEYYTGTTWVTL